MARQRKNVSEWTRWTHKNTNKNTACFSPLTDSPEDIKNIRVLVFNSGGHYAFLKYSNEVICECDKFLNSIIKVK